MFVFVENLNLALATYETDYSFVPACGIYARFVFQVLAMFFFCVEPWRASENLTLGLWRRIGQLQLESALLPDPISEFLGGERVVHARRIAYWKTIATLILIIFEIGIDAIRELCNLRFQDESQKQREAEIREAVVHCARQAETNVGAHGNQARTID